MDTRYVGDLTYVWTWSGFAYIATVIDLASRRVVGWAVGDNMRTKLVEDALHMAFAQRRGRNVFRHHQTRAHHDQGLAQRQRAPPGRVQLRRGLAFNHRRLHGEITDDNSYTAPAEFEALYYRQNQPALPAVSQ